MAKKVRTKVIDRGFNGIIKSLKELDKKPFVKAGYPAEHSKKDQFKTFTIEEGTSKEISPDVTVLDVAIWNEFGTATSPERSFMRSAFDKNIKKYERLAKEMLAQIYLAKTTVGEALDKLGLILEADIKKMIIEGDFEANAISTIMRKGSDKPLIDTAQMLNAITSKKIMNGKSALSKLGSVIRSGSVSST